MIFSNAVESWLREEQELSDWYDRHHFVRPRLSASGMTYCKRRQILNVLEGTDDPRAFKPSEMERFDKEALLRMRTGVLNEHDTYLALKSRFPVVFHGVPIWFGNWAAEIDILIGYCGEFPSGAIVEHKSTHTYNFRRGALPYTSHMLQAIAYGRMMKEAWGLEVPTYIFYRSWHHDAEFRVWESDKGLHYEGYIDREMKNGGRPGEHLVDYMAPLQEELHSPLLPQKLKDPFSGWQCTKKAGRNHRVPNCEYWNLCWESQLGDGPFTEGLEYD
jgi:hypothetical protein